MKPHNRLRLSVDAGHSADRDLLARPRVVRGLIEYAPNDCARFYVRGRAPYQHIAVNRVRRAGGLPKVEQEPEPVAVGDTNLKVVGAPARIVANLLRVEADTPC